jgi:catechol 2,3-dioxygenase-like lactoylglutathione lyase family enzyme
MPHVFVLLRAKSQAGQCAPTIFPFCLKLLQSLRQLSERTEFHRMRPSPPFLHYAAMQLDHSTIVTKHLEAARHFFCVVVGMTEGPRPPFKVNGHWLYADGRPVIHLVEATLPGVDGRASPRIDHVAFRVNDAGRWKTLVDRLRSNDVPFSVTHLPLANEVQLFVSLGASLAVEFVTALNIALSTEAF